MRKMREAESPEKEAVSCWGIGLILKASAAKKPEEQEPRINGYGTGWPPVPFK